LRGRVLDVDSHESVPCSLWQEHFGDAGALLAPMMELMGSEGPNSPAVDVHADELDITDENVWTVKGCAAPSAIDLKRRPLVLDLIGIDRQLVFPGFGLVGLFLSSSTNETVSETFGVDASAMDLPAMAKMVSTAHNDWCIERAAIDSRVRPVGVICTYEFDEMIAEAERLLAGGVRAVWIPASVPPAGVSPADQRLDPFWRLFADAGVPVILHIGSEFSFMRTRVWKNVPVFETSVMSSIEFPLDPWTFATTHFAPENFLSAVLLGGVFERHPTLRFGIIEYGAHWVGPMAENQDLWASKFPKRFASVLSMKPSEYLQRNVRVSPYAFEPVDRFIERHGLEDVYCFATDFPHVEGGTDPHVRLERSLAPLGDDVLEKFFVTNGELLLPV
jgi:predicted TIM-barrel fold metal-dependent hydrolase